MSNQNKQKIVVSTALNTIASVYDFSVKGGAIGSIGTGIFIPAGSHVTKVYLENLTTFAGATATVALTMSSAGDLLAAVVGTTLTAAITTGIPTGIASTIVKNVSGVEKQITLDIAVAALTAGKYNIHVEYK